MASRDPAEAGGSAGQPQGSSTAQQASTIGARHMSQRIASRNAALKPKSLEPKYAPVYPVYQKAAPVGVKDAALRVHPKGFRMLSKSSPLERNMASYFRLPAQPPKHVTSERDALKRQIDKELRQSGANADGTQGLVLDGFMILEAAGAQDPAEVTSVTICDSNLVAAASEDLSYFVNVTTADFGENSLPIADLVPLSGLETLHLHCNTLSSVSSLAPGAFPRLHTLNLSFNQLKSSQLQALSGLPLLERLDLSCNALGDLPRSISQLRSLRQLALENNRLSKAESVFLTLGLLPELSEVNLNYNKLSTVPSLHELLENHNADAAAARQQAGGDGAADPDVEAGDASSGPRELFPNLTVLGMGANQFVYFEDLFNLSELPRLEQAVLWGNPIEARRKDAEVLTYEMDQRGIVIVLDSPVPGKKKQVEFFTDSKRDHVRVPAVDGRGLPRGHKLRTKKRHVDTEPPKASSPAAEEDDTTGGSFFMTQASAERPAPASGTPAASQGTTPAALGRDTFGSDPQAAASSAPASAGQPHRPTRVGRVSTAGSTGSSRLPSPITHPAGLSDADVHGGPSSLQQRLQLNAAQVDAAATRRTGNIRSVMAELRNMLRQPLPPLQRPRFAGAASKGRKGHAKTAHTELSDSDSDDAPQPEL